MSDKWLMFKNADEFKYLTESKQYKVLNEYSAGFNGKVYVTEDDGGNRFSIPENSHIYDYEVFEKYPLSDNIPYLKPATDNVTNPSHYTNGNIETIDYLKDTLSKEQYEGFCRGNVLKYISRYPHKNGVEDLNKAKTYLEWLIESVEE